MKSVVPEEPKEAAKDAASAAKDSLPEPPKDIPNPFQSIFGEARAPLFRFLRQTPMSDACHSQLAQLTSHAAAYC